MFFGNFDSDKRKNRSTIKWYSYKVGVNEMIFQQEPDILLQC